MQNISQKQRTAIRFYMGDPEIVQNGPYRGGPKAYNTINALLHLGTQDEEDKIRDGKPIELLDVSHLKSYLELIHDIKCAMEIYRNSHQNDTFQSLVTYRIDRISALERFQKDSQIYGYFSTCKWGFLPEYAHTKSDIVLLEVHRDSDVPYLDFAELFQEFYAKPEEAEILLPYGAFISEITEIALSEDENQKYYDMNGNRPRGKWKIRVSSETRQAETKEILDSVYDFITNEYHVARICQCMRMLSEKKMLSVEDGLFYYRWKQMVLRYAVGR